MEDFIIKKEKKIDRIKWDEFLINSSNYKLSACIEYYMLLEADIFFILTYDKNNSIIGGTICRIRGAVFPFSLLSKSLWIESGLLVNSRDPLTVKEIKSKMLQFVEKEARSKGCICVKFNHWCNNESAEVFQINNFDVCNNATFVSDLSLSQDELYSKLDRNTKSAIKRARKIDLKFELVKKPTPEKISEFYQIYYLTQKRAIDYNKNASMTLKSEAFINGILDLDNLNCYFGSTSLNGTLAAGLILVKSGETLIGYIAASDIELNRQYGASSLLFWESMMWAKDQGLKYFDFGGVPDNPEPDDPAFGVYRFKKNFGGEFTTFQIGQKVLSPLKSKVFTKILDSRSIVRFVMKFSKKF